MTAGVAENLTCASPIVTTTPIPGFPFTGNLSHFSAPVGENPSDSVVWFYTGLSEQTTLTIRARWMIERFPNDQEPEIIVLATPSPPLDPIALEIYSRISQMMPAAVMFKENDNTEWWKRVLGGIAEVAGPLLLAGPHPAMKAAGAAILTGNKVLNPENAKKKVTVDQNGALVATKRSAAKKKKKAKKAQQNAIQPVPLKQG